MSIGTPELIIILLIILIVVGGDHLLRVMRALSKEVADARHELSLAFPNLYDESIDVGAITDSEGIAIGSNNQVIVIKNPAAEIPDLSLFATAPLGVFVSSPEAFSEEREAARHVIETLSGLSKPWIIQLVASPQRSEDLVADWIGRCDVFLAVLGEDIPEAQRREQELAIANHINNRMYFVKNSDHVDDVIEMFNANKANVVKFANVQELEDQIRRSLVNLLLESVRDNNRYQLNKNDVIILIAWGKGLGFDIEMPKAFIKELSSNIAQHEKVHQVSSDVARYYLERMKRKTPKIAKKLTNTSSNIAKISTTKHYFFGFKEKKDYTLAPGHHILLDEKRGNSFGLSVTSDQPVEGSIVFDLLLFPDPMNINISPELFYTINDHGTFLKSFTAQNCTIEAKTGSLIAFDPIRNVRHTLESNKIILDTEDLMSWVREKKIHPPLYLTMRMELHFELDSQGTRINASLGQTDASVIYTGETFPRTFRVIW